MTGTHTATDLREKFRRWISQVEAPLSRHEQEVAREESLVAADRQALVDEILAVARQIEAALDLEQVPQVERHELYLLVLRPDSPEAVDEVDDKILDRLIGHAVRTRNLEDLVFYARAMAGGKHSAHDVRLRHMSEILQAVADAAPAQA